MGLGALVVGVTGEVNIFARDEFGNALITTSEADLFFLEVMVLAPGSLGLTSAWEMLMVLVTEKMLTLTSSGWAIVRMAPMMAMRTRARMSIMM